jgi:hypothetical protein
MVRLGRLAHKGRQRQATNGQAKKAAHPKTGAREANQSSSCPSSCVQGCRDDRQTQAKDNGDHHRSIVVGGSTRSDRRVTEKEILRDQNYDCQLASFDNIADHQDENVEVSLS